MNRTYKSVLCLALLGVCLVTGGCVGPHYTRHPLVIFGKAAPEIAGVDVQAIQKSLSVTPGPKVSLLTTLTAFSTTPFKCLGLQGWKDFELDAEAHGTVVQSRVSSDRFLTADLRLSSLAVNGNPIPLQGERFIRLEIFLGRAPVEKSRFKGEDARIVASGKLVWDTDGWFEIHPQKGSDVRRE